MRPNLSLETISAALAVLGTGVMLSLTPACGGDPKTPVDANEVNGATEKAADGASHCGAGKDHKAGQAGCSAAAAAGDAKPADTSAAGGATSTATPSTAMPAATTPSATTPSTPADAKAATGTPAPASTTGKKPAAPATPPAKKGGSGSCGAGTCSAKK